MTQLSNDVTYWLASQIGKRFPVGQQLPALEDLMVKFEEDMQKPVSRMTVRQGLKPLAMRGIIRITQGTGTTVLRPVALSEGEGDSTEGFEAYREHPLIQMAITAALQAIQGGIRQEEALKYALVMAALHNEPLV